MLLSEPNQKMSVKYKKTDLLEDSEVNVIVHQANCFCTLGSGIARKIRDKYYCAAEADAETVRGDYSKMGHFSIAETDDGKRVVNLYSQYSMGGDKRYTDYEAMHRGLTELKEIIETAGNNKTSYIIGFPFRIGSGQAGGSWRIVEAIIRDIFEESELNTIICVLPEDEPAALEYFKKTNQNITL